MSNADKLTAALAANESKLPDFRAKAEAINSCIRGWSNANHYWFFRSWLDTFPEARNVLMVGVYLGRDISYLLDAAGERELVVTGIDKFNAEPCDDWPKEKRGMTWERAFHCPAPDKGEAMVNIWETVARDAALRGIVHGVQIIKADDKEWLESANGAYDLIFLDTSHDEPTVARQIRSVHKLCHPFTVVAGDDYANLEKTWGVETAVKAAFKSHQVIDSRIWFAGSEDYL